MVHTVNTHEAKTHLSRLLAEVEAGGEVVIARAGKPVARLVPALAPQPIQLDTARGKVWMSPDWEFSEGELAEFEGPLNTAPE
ncbi:MAG: type II toxin-antitoxin system Phd/YefM family antitoxin [Dehalococcoidia bacterium]